MGAKRKLMISLFSIVFVVFAVVTTFSVVYAMTQQEIETLIDMEYTVEDIDGYVEATYTVGNNTNYLIPIGSNIQDNKLIFKAEDTENAGSLEFPNEVITLTEENDNMIIKYSYSNTGDKHYIASMDFESEFNKNNMIVEYGIIDSSTGVVNYSTNRYAVVVPANSTNKEYYIRVSIDDKTNYASFTASINWILQGCDPQSAEYLSYENLDIQGVDGVYTASYTGGYIHTGELVYPSEINGSPVTAVASSSTITPEQKSYIKNVTIPESVTTIENNAFNGFTYLEEVVFGEDSEVSVQSASISSLKTIGEYAFANCERLEVLTLPSTVTNIGKNVFENCYNLKQITISNVATLTDAMFKNCSSLTTVEISENIVNIPAEIFSGCSELVDFEFPKIIETIGVSAFKDCSRIVGEVDLSCATNVGESAFENCSSLTKVTIGENITTLANNTFAGCENVEKYYLLSHNAITTLSDINVLKNINNDCKIYVIETLLSDYSADENWLTYADKFAEIGFTTDGTCVDTLAEQVIDFKIVGNNKNILPTAYQQIEYIESTGEQYINTEVLPSNNLKTEMDIDFVGLDANNYSGIFGSRVSTTSNGYAIFAYNQGHSRYGEIAVNYGYYDTSFKSNVKINGRHKLTIDEGSFYVDNEVIYNVESLHGNEIIFNSDIPIYVFGVNNNGKLYKPAGGYKLYSLKFYSDNVIIRDYIPCYRKTDNIAGIFDLVEQKFYTNLGTGEFVKGQDITSTPETPVEIESVGEKTKNLLDLFGRSLGTLPVVSGNTSIRDFEFDKYYVGLTMNNYYYPSNIVSYSITENSITINSKQSGYGLGYPVKVNPNTTYTISNVAAGLFGIGFYTTNIEYISYVQSSTFTTPENCEILTVILKPYSLNTDTIHTKIQLEEGTTATEYEPYGYKVPIKVNNTTTNIYLNEPLRKIGDYADYIDYKNKKVVRNVISIDLSGLNWATTENSSKNGQFWAKPDANIVFPEAQHIIGDFICSDYVVTSYNKYTTMDKIIYSANSTKLIYIRDTDYTDLTQFKNSISGILLAKLVTPTEEKIDIPEFTTFAGGTTFEVLTTVQPSQVMVKYHK